ncbi:MAG: dephospho-CoA kinase [Tatlockia sp.]|jgi:dephospho-CoA kinase
MYCIGLTGNIASGKSTVSRFFKNKGIHVISADEAARQLTEVDTPLLAAITERFGSGMLSESGALNRSKLRELIFQNPNDRVWLEQLLHPPIRKHIAEKIAHSTSPYTIVEIPLLKERSHYPYLNRVLLVLADSEVQINRIIARDNTSEEQAKAILKTQSEEEKLRQIADDVILNCGSLPDLAKKVEKLHAQYLQFARQKS